MPSSTNPDKKKCESKSWCPFALFLRLVRFVATYEIPYSLHLQWPVSLLVNVFVRPSVIHSVTQSVSQSVNAIVYFPSLSNHSLAKFMIRESRDWLTATLFPFLAVAYHRHGSKANSLPLKWWMFSGKESNEDITVSTEVLSAVYQSCHSLDG